MATTFAALWSVGKVEFDRTGDRKVDAENYGRIGVLVEVRPAPQNKYGYEFGLLPRYSLRSKAIENHIVTPILQEHS